MAEIEFRDGKRVIPDHLAAILAPYEARMYKITYVEAVEFANRVMLTDLLDRKQSEVINAHFSNLRRS